MPLVRHLIALGHEVVLAGESDGSEEAIRAEGIRFEHWSLRSDGVNPFGELRALRALAAIYDNLQPDLGMHYTIKGVIYGGLVARRRRVPYFAFITGLGFAFINDSLITRLARRLYRSVLDSAQAVVFLNKDDREEFEKRALLGRAPAVMLPGEGIDLTHFVSRQVSRLAPMRVLFIGRLLVDKGVREFVKAAAIVRQTRPDVVFELLGKVGAPNPTAISMRELDSWLAEGNVIYGGETADVRPAIETSSIVVLPSYREGLPRALLEAAAMSRPIVATDVPGCRDVVRHGETGLLVPVRDASALAAAILDLANRSEADLQAMGRAGRILVSEKFSEAIVFSVYDRLLQRTPLSTGDMCSG